MMSEKYPSYLGRLMKNTPAWDVDRLTAEVKLLKEGGAGGGEGGSVVVDSTINGNIRVNAVEVKVYDDSAINTALSGKASTTHNHDSAYEPVISSKGTAFNKNFGSVVGTVSEGNHSHNGMVTSTSVASISVLTQVQYDALGTEKNTNNVLYVIRG
jgi:hypothetical protein